MYILSFGTSLQSTDFSLSSRARFPRVLFAGVSWNSFKERVPSGEGEGTAGLSVINSKKNTFLPIIHFPISFSRFV